MWPLILAAIQFKQQQNAKSRGAIDSAFSKGEQLSGQTEAQSKGMMQREIPQPSRSSALRYRLDALKKLTDGDFSGAGGDLFRSTGTGQLFNALKEGAPPAAGQADLGADLAARQAALNNIQSGVNPAANAGAAYSAPKTVDTLAYLKTLGVF